MLRQSDRSQFAAGQRGPRLQAGNQRAFLATQPSQVRHIENLEGRGDILPAFAALGDVLIGHRPDVRLVYLKGDAPLIARRIATRHEHFMPASLLASQFQALEEPGPDERPIIVSIEPGPREIVANIIRELGLEPARR